MTQSAPFYLYKGDDTHFDGANVIQFVVNSTADLSRFSGYFQLGEFKQITNLTNGVMRVEIPRSYTGNFLFGPMRGVFRLVDKLGRIKTAVNDLEFYITDDISLLGQNQSIEVTGVDYQILVEVNLPLTNYNDLNDKPTINGVTVQGDKTDEDYGLQHKLTAASNMDITNNVISAKVDGELKDDSELPVQNKVVKGALDAAGADLSAHVQDKNNPHEVTKAQVGLGQVDNTADIDKPVSTAQQAAIDAHANRTDNPHNVTKAQVGLGSVDNTSDANKPISTAQQAAFDNKQDKLTQTQLDAVNSGADAAKIATIGQNTQAIGVIEGKIPSQASVQNQLADKNFVNSSINTNTANFIGTFNSVAELEAYSGTVTNNDYAFVIAVDGDGNTVYNRYKYSTSVTPSAWLFEYALNNSSFTAEQWAAIQSGITAALVAQITTNKDDIASLQTTKLDASTAAATYLTQNNAASTYLTKTDAAATYLKLTGGTLTGMLDVETIQAGGTDLIKKNGSSVIVGNNTQGLALLADSGANLQAKLGNVWYKLLTGADKNVANGIAPLDANSKVPLANLPVDGVLDETSENPVQNKVIVAALLERLVGVSFTNTSATGTRTYGAKNMKWSKSTDTVAGEDDFIKHPCFWGYDAIVKYNSVKGYAEQVAVEGTYEFKQYLLSGATDFDVVRMIHIFWYKRTVTATGAQDIILSPIPLPGFQPSPMHYREGKLHEWVGITKYMFSSDGASGVCSQPGRIPKSNTSENAFEQQARARGLYVMGLKEVSSIQMLGCVKYASLNWQNTVGRGHCDHPGTQRAVTVAQTNASSVIISNAYRNDFSTNVCLLLNNTNYEITSIEDYDENNIQINIVGTVTTTTSSTVRPGLARTGFSSAILGVDGENVGMASQNGRRTVLTMGIEDFYGNAWKELAGGCRMSGKFWINPTPDTSYAWPTEADPGNWKEVCSAITTSGYQGRMVATDDLGDFTFMMVPAATGGNADNPIGDYVYSDTATAPRIMLLGGYVGIGSADGPFYWHLYYAVSNTRWDLSACGVFVPREE